jgi:hypothetical protein
MNTELHNFSEWIRANKLSLNIKKSKYMILASRRKAKPSSSNIMINGLELQQTESIKYLGVNIDQNLSWKVHINTIAKKIAKNVGLLSKIRHYVDLDTLRKIYFALIYPYLQYGLLYGEILINHI